MIRDDDPIPFYSFSFASNAASLPQNYLSMSYRLVRTKASDICSMSDGHLITLGVRVDMTARWLGSLSPFLLSLWPSLGQGTETHGRSNSLSTIESGSNELDRPTWKVSWTLTNTAIAGMASYRGDETQRSSKPFYFIFIFELQK